MSRSAVLLSFLLVGCGRTEPTSSAPPPAVSSSVSPPSPEPAASSAEPASSAPPTPVVQPLAGFPAVDGACTQDSDCGAAFFDGQCCRQCEPRVGNKAWVKKVNAFCTSKDAGARADCGPKACSWVFGAPRCADGRCVSR